MSDVLDNSILTYLQKIDKKISQLECDIETLKDHLYQKDASLLSSCPQGNYSGTTEDQLDLDEQNFDKAWYFKHYKIDCPEFDQPLTLKAFQEIGYEMSPVEYGKYIAQFNDDQLKACMHMN